MQPPASLLWLWRVRCNITSCSPSWFSKYATMPLSLTGRNCMSAYLSEGRTWLLPTIGRPAVAFTCTQMCRQGCGRTCGELAHQQTTVLRGFMTDDLRLNTERQLKRTSTVLVRARCTASPPRTSPTFISPQNRVVREYFIRIMPELFVLLTTAREMSEIDICFRFLADRTNDRAYAAVFRLSACLSSVCDVCIVAKRCVLELKLLLTAYRKSYMRNRIDWYQVNDLHLFRGRLDHVIEYLGSR